MPLDLDPEDGYLVVNLPGRAAVALDVYDASGAYAALCDRFDPKEEADALFAAWGEYLTDKGFPPALSRGNLALVLGAVMDECERFKKKVAPASPPPG